MENQEQIQEKKIHPWRLVRSLFTAAAAVVAVAVTAWTLNSLTHTSAGGNMRADAGPDWNVLDRYDSWVADSVGNALDGMEPIRWIWELSDGDLVAPEPNPVCFGQTRDPSELQWLLDAAEEKLGVQVSIFSTDTKIMSGSKVTYYLDDSILSITWKEVRAGGVYTMSEVKIAHVSQFRRYLSDGVYGSDGLYWPTKMAAQVNAVTAMNGDFYMQRSWGVNVYMGQVRNVKKIVDTCYITGNGDLIFTRAGELETVEEAQAFADEHQVRFSLAFGPVLVENGQNVVPDSYPLGEIDGHYARSALCQLGQLHYLLVVVNSENGNRSMPTSAAFADQLIKLGVEKAFSLDGGQSAAIVTNDRLINRPTFGEQRTMSDIIYFATAIPEDRWPEE